MPPTPRFEPMVPPSPMMAGVAPGMIGVPATPVNNNENLGGHAHHISDTADSTAPSQSPGKKGRGRSRRSASGDEHKPDARSDDIMDLVSNVTKNISNFADDDRPFELSWGTPSATPSMTPFSSAGSAMLPPSTPLIGVPGASTPYGSLQDVGATARYAMSAIGAKFDMKPDTNLIKATTKTKAGAADGPLEETAKTKSTGRRKLKVREL